jgi:hypothetical protein
LFLNEDEIKKLINTIISVPFQSKSGGKNGVLEENTEA